MKGEFLFESLDLFIEKVIEPEIGVIESDRLINAAVVHSVVLIYELVHFPPQCDDGMTDALMTSIKMHTVPLTVFAGLFDFSSLAG
jgi:hypothetical protein